MQYRRFEPPVRAGERQGLLSVRTTDCLLVLAICFFPARAAQCAEKAKQRSWPNIVLLIADDLGYGELGCQGNRQIPTPHIDSLARQGIRFTDGYVTAPYCSASRAGLMTGRYPTRFGYEFNPVGHYNEHPDAGLPDDERTLADLLHDAGYATALIGKWHLGAQARNHPYRRGFDEFFGFLHEGHYYVPPPYDGVTTMLRRRALPGGQRGRWFHPDGKLIYSAHMGYDEPDYDANNPILRGGQPVAEHAYLTDALTREAVDFMRRRRSHPFFLCVAYNAVHSPLQAADKYMKRFAHIEDIHRRIFAGMLANMDDSVGAILAQIDEAALEEQTLVVFLSDNGGPTRELTSSNRPLRGEKGDLYEGGIRVPMLMRWPGELPENRIERRPVSALDIYATAARLSGQTLPKDAQYDGVDLLPYLTGEVSDPPHEVLYWRMGRRGAVRLGQWKLVRNDRRSIAAWELYDLQADLGERHDLAAERPQVVERLARVWKGLDAQMIDPLWRPGKK